MVPLETCRWLPGADDDDGAGNRGGSVGTSHTFNLFTRCVGGRMA